jgi:enoyl-CoA hydratase/carnithine racemase
MMSEWILYEVADGVCTITMNRPEKKNAMSFAMLSDFIAAFSRAGEDSDARVVVAGTDLSDLSSVPGEKRGLRGSAEETGKWWPIVECPKPVIGVVDGPAVGMGAEFASQCDIRIASNRARFAWNFAHRGLVPDTGAGSWLLPRLIGTSQALWLLYSGEFISAREAHDLKFISGVYEPEELEDRTRELTDAMLKGSPFSLQRIKALVYEGLGSNVGEHMVNHTTALAECFKSEDHKEGVASFLERRAPNFKGN